MSALVHTALSVTPPVQEKNLWVKNGTAASVAVAIPDAWRNAYLTVQATGDNFYFAFGVSTIVVDETVETTFPYTFDGDECILIEAGKSVDFDMRQLDRSVTHFAMKGSGTSGELRFTRSSGRVSAT